MIKVIAFDLVGVLVREKNIELNDIESKLERRFGPNIDDASYLNEFSDINNLISTTKNIINKLYEIKDKDLLSKIKENNKDIKIIIATNHLSYVREYIINNFKEVDDIIISAEINKIKPNKDFYEYILNKYNIKPNELLFLDNNVDNIVSAEKLGINVIKVDKDTNMYLKIFDIIK